MEAQKPPRTQPVHHGGFTIVGLILSFYAICFSFVYYCHGWLPAPKGLDEQGFSEARTRVLLNELMDIGIRTVGSKQNEKDAPEWILKKISELPGKVTVDVQHPNGAFGLNFLSQFQSVYANVTNILVKVEPEFGNGQNALLISSHFDTATGTKGASDDGVSIAIMLEILRIVSKHPPKFGALIFNFNGAEETLLQASHGFITQHPWKEQVKAFMNLEAAGAGGRELLFQTGSDILGVAYASGAVYPHASSVAQEVFQSGVIPSDTDYRIYRDYGKVPGMDFAYIANGYVYHTWLDDVTQIQLGAVQRFGENLIGTIQQLTKEESILASVSSHENSEKHIYFDIHGMFIGSILAAHSFWFNVVVFLAGCTYMITSKITPKQRFDGAVDVACMIGASFGTMLLVVTFLTFTAPLSWYANPWFGAVLIIFSLMSGYAVCWSRLSTSDGGSAMMTKYSGNLAIREESLFEAVLSNWMIFLGLSLYFRLDSTYVIGSWVWCPLISRFLSNQLRKTKYYTLNAYVLVYVAGFVVPVCHSMQVMSVGLQFFFPLMGRSGTSVPPDIAIGIIVSLFSLFLLSYCVSMLSYLERKCLEKAKFMLCICTLGMIIASLLMNPYSKECPKRVYLLHTKRVHQVSLDHAETDSGVWVFTADYLANEPMRRFWKDAGLWDDFPRADHHTHADDIYGNFPWLHPVKDLLPLRNSWYLPAPEPPAFEHPVSLKVVSSKLVNTQRKIHFRLQGPAQMTIFIDAKHNPLAAWSIGNGTVEIPDNEKDSYFIKFASGFSPSEFHFWLLTDNARPLRLAIAGHQLDHKTDTIKAAIAALPDYFHVTTAISSWTSYIV